MDNAHDISVLNDLIRTTLDSSKGYAEAGKDTEGAHTHYYTRMASERSEAAKQLQAQVSALGGDAEDDSSFAGAAHRGFMDIKQAVAGDSDQAVIEEVERGEDYIKAKYLAALKDQELSQPTRQVIEAAYESVRRGHDTASEMKHQMEG